jgi:hypothetical protein
MAHKKHMASCTNPPHEEEGWEEVKGKTTGFRRKRSADSAAATQVDTFDSISTKFTSLAIEESPPPSPPKPLPRITEADTNTGDMSNAISSKGSGEKVLTCDDFPSMAAAKPVATTPWGPRIGGWGSDDDE